MGGRGGKGGSEAFHRTPRRRPRRIGVGEAGGTKGRLMCETRGIVRREDPQWS